MKKIYQKPAFNESNTVTTSQQVTENNEGERPSLLRLHSEQNRLNGNETGHVLDPQAINNILLSAQERRELMLAERVRYFVRTTTDSAVENSPLPIMTQGSVQIENEATNSSFFGILNNRNTGTGNKFFNPQYRVPDGHNSVIIEAPSVPINNDNRTSFVSDLQSRVSTTEYNPQAFVGSPLNDQRRILSQRLREESNRRISSASNTELNQLRVHMVEAPNLSEIVVSNEIRTHSLEIPLTSFFGIFTNTFIIEILAMLTSSNPAIPVSVLFTLLMTYRGIFLTILDVRFWFYSVQNILNAFRVGFQGLRVISLANIVRVLTNVASTLASNLVASNVVTRNITASLNASIERLRLSNNNSWRVRLVDFFNTASGRILGSTFIFGLGAFFLGNESYRGILWGIINNIPTNIRVRALREVTETVSRELQPVIEGPVALFHDQIIQETLRILAEFFY